MSSGYRYKAPRRRIPPQADDVAASSQTQANARGSKPEEVRPGSWRDAILAARTPFPPLADTATPPEVARTYNGGKWAEMGSSTACALDCRLPSLRARACAASSLRMVPDCRWSSCLYKCCVIRSSKGLVRQQGTASAASASPPPLSHLCSERSLLRLAWVENPACAGQCRVAWAIGGRSATNWRRQRSQRGPATTDSRVLVVHNDVKGLKQR